MSVAGKNTETPLFPEPPFGTEQLPGLADY
jgi:hypothetical protein